MTIPLIINRGWEGLPSLSKALYSETYFRPNEDYEQWLNKIVKKYQNDDAHGERMRTYIHNYWYHPSTPISSDRGLPISCYVSHIPDTREGIFYGFLEGMWLGAEGGGRGVYWSDVRPAGSPISGTNSTSSGLVPFLGISDRATYGISQAGTRRSTEAAYVLVHHADILDFIDIRLETGDPNRRTPNLHQGVVITDKFMHAVKNLQPWDLYDSNTGEVVETVDAFDLWIDILLNRKRESGEPFLLFIDTVNNNKPIEYKLLDVDVYSSNICTEITLATDQDKSSVCNLGSVNLEYYDEYENVIDQVIADISDFHDNVNNVFLDMTSGLDEAMERYRTHKDNRDDVVKLLAFERVRNAVIDERNIGIGAMGWHSLCQQKHIPLESPMARGLNNRIFEAIRAASDKHQDSLSEREGFEPCPMAKRAGTKRRNIHTMAIAPTMSISNLSALTSSGIEPWVSNSFTKKLTQGSFSIRNKYLDAFIKQSYNEQQKIGIALPDDWVDEQWRLINKAGGSVMSLTWMMQYDKDVFKTAFEIDQRTLLVLAGDRQPSIDQSQSLNLFLPAECSYETLYAIHVMAWELGLKSVYYLRSEPETNADTSAKERKPILLEDDACVSCT